MEKFKITKLEEKNDNDIFIEVEIETLGKRGFVLPKRLFADDTFIRLSNEDINRRDTILQLKEV